MFRLLRRLLFLLPPEVAHGLAIGALSLLEPLPALCRALRRLTTGQTHLPCKVAGLSFDNPIGLAAGFDKDAEAVAGLFALGFGFVEIGTVTPRPQPGNPPPRLFRVPEHRALINRMGFNNHGARAAAGRLRELSFRPGLVGANLGKNKTTPNERAADDYLSCLDELAPLSDYLVLNASSPNTPGLRELQEPEALRALLQAVVRRRDERAPGKPVFLKIAPDLSLEAVDEIVDVALECKIDGLVATNTTIARPFEGPLANQTGGLSGAPLRARSTEVIRRAFRRARGKLPIIGVGGVFSAEDAYEKLRAGAALVQVYTGFVYEGPAFVRRLLLGLRSLLERDGFASVAEVIGLDSEHGSAGLRTNLSSGLVTSADATPEARDHHR